MIEVASTESARSWFCVWNNPQEHCKELAGLEPRELVEKVADMWVANKPTRSCAINYEKADTGTFHMHMVLEDKSKCRFSSVLKAFPGIHCEVSRGTKADIEDYIYKRGRFEEKNHTIIISPVFRGNITSNRTGKSIIDDIEMLLDSGMTPMEIMRLSLRYRKEENLIKKGYFGKRFDETPPLRPVYCHYHIGRSGCGKSYIYPLLCEEHGEDKVYFATDHNENGMFDEYYGQPILIIDELRYIRYEILLQITQGYKAHIHCRYQNGTALWSDVHITSILPPEKLYENIVPLDRRSDDGIEQLMRRITDISYHYKIGEEYKTFTIPGSEYKNYEALKNRAASTLHLSEIKDDAEADQPSENEFVSVTDCSQLEIPFN